MEAKYIVLVVVLVALSVVLVANTVNSASVLGGNSWMTTKVMPCASAQVNGYNVCNGDFDLMLYANQLNKTQLSKCGYIWIEAIYKPTPISATFTTFARIKASDFTCSVNYGDGLYGDCDFTKVYNFPGSLHDKYQSGTPVTVKVYLYSHDVSNCPLSLSYSKEIKAYNGTVEPQPTPQPTPSPSPPTPSVLDSIMQLLMSMIQSLFGIKQ